MKKQRWSIKPWNPSEDILKEIHYFRKEGRSYRYIAVLYGVHNTTIHKYYKAWLPKRNWFLRTSNWIFRNKSMR